MARRVRAASAAVEGLRALQIAKFQARLDRLPQVCDVYDFSVERAELARRIAELEAGEAVSVQAWELADELVPAAGLKSRFNQAGPKCFRLVGDVLVAESVG